MSEKDKWLIIYKSPCSIGKANAFGSNEREAEEYFRKKYGYWGKELSAEIAEIVKVVRICT